MTNTPTGHEESFESIDRYFAHAMASISGESNPLVIQVLCEVSAAAREGNVCIHLKENEALSDTTISDTVPVRMATVIGALRQSPLVGDGVADTPLVMDESGRVYLHRFWKTQQRLIQDIVRRARPGKTAALPGAPDDRAVALASESDFLVVTGGPGAGKTTLVATVLSSLIAHNPEIRIGACAPTGKAAVRLREAIEKSRVSPLLLERFPSAVVKKLPEDVRTIHKLLAPVKGTTRFRYSRDRQLPLDVLVVDEASMVDLQLMSALFDAMPSTGKVILLGDQYQLSSIEPGRVLGDICFGAQMKPPTNNDAVARCIVTLLGSHRFGKESAIGQLAAAVNSGDADLAVRTATESQSPEITFVDVRDANARRRMATLVETLFAPGAQAKAPAQRLRCFESVRFLCGVNHGPFGVQGLNRLAESQLSRLGLINPDNDLYDGKPIIIPQNDYNVSLFNGDTGVVCKEDNKLFACFGRENDQIRKLPVSALRQHLPAYATTIHKAQGSEFDHVVLVLPESSPLLTRELLYTAVTRAKKKLTVFATPQAIAHCVIHPSQREFSLGYHLWGTDE